MHHLFPLQPFIAETLRTAGPTELRGYLRYLGILFPFALNFSPIGVSGPAPCGFVWQAPQDSFVSAANCAVAAAGRETANEIAPAIVSTEAVAQVRAYHRLCRAFIILVILCWGGVIHE